METLQTIVTMLSSLKKPSPTPLMVKFFENIEYFEEISEVGTPADPDSSEAKSQNTEQRKLYWCGQMLQASSHQ